jgi:hypothetical protein
MQGVETAMRRSPEETRIQEQMNLFGFADLPERDPLPDEPEERRHPLGQPPVRIRQEFL